MTTIVTLKDALHLRPASHFAQIARQFKSKITVRYGDREADGSRVTELLLLQAPVGAEVKIEAEGEDSAAATAALRGLL
jgi:phosphotransferase system HPr (HPr) family protein